MAVGVCAHLCFCDAMDHSPSGFSVPGLFLARMQDCVVISSFRGSSHPRDLLWQVDSLPLNQLGSLYIIGSVINSIICIRWGFQPNFSLFFSYIMVYNSQLTLLNTYRTSFPKRSCLLRALLLFNTVTVYPVGFQRFFLAGWHNILELYTIYSEFRIILGHIRF